MPQIKFTCEICNLEHIAIIEIDDGAGVPVLNLVIANFDNSVSLDYICPKKQKSGELHIEAQEAILNQYENARVVNTILVDENNG